MLNAFFVVLRNGSEEGEGGSQSALQGRSKTMEMKNVLRS